MAVKVVLPLTALDQQDVDFLLGRIAEYFSFPAIFVFAHPNALPVATDSAKPEARPYSQLAPRPGDVIVGIADFNGSLPDVGQNTPGELEFYYIDQMGRIFSQKKQVTTKEYPDQEAHVFNRLGWREPGNGFYYYPYGYLFRDTSVGKIDSLGFRVLSDLSFLVDRPASHKVVVILGGSAAFSMYSSYSEMFSSVLERSITAALKERSTDDKITVLNFGMHGNVVVNEILSFILYCNKFRPDAVIAHDGWNDFAYGLISDMHLIEKWDLIYQYNLETWGQFTHASYDRRVNQTRVPYESVNLAYSVLRAYMIRKRQLADLVKSTGAHFVWGLQPSIYNKPSISPKEVARTQLGDLGMGSFSKVYPKVQSLYEMFAEGIRDAGIENFIDFPKIFSEFDHHVTHFADHVHTVPEGDRVIAQVYKKVLMPLLFDGPDGGTRT